MVRARYSSNRELFSLIVSPNLAQAESNFAKASPSIYLKKKNVSMTIALLNHRRVRSALATQNLKQESFAELVGISDRHVRNLCNRDTNVNVALFYRICTVLEIPMMEMLVFLEPKEK